LQPSEFVKIALIIMLAWHGDHAQRKMNTIKRGILIPGIIIAVALSLIFIEPDRGTTILLAAVSGTMLMIAGVRWLHVIPPVLLGLLIDRARFVPLAVVCLALLFLTQLIYPWMYDDLLNAKPVAVIVITLRNLLELGVWVWSVRLVLGRTRSSVG